MTTVNKTDLSLYSDNPNTFEKYSNPLAIAMDIQEAVEKITIVYFGIRSGLLDEVLIESVIKTIIQRFKNLTPQDLINSFERIEVKRDGWKNITKSDIIDPIQNWWNKKAEIKYELNKFKYEEKRKEESRKLQEEFVEESLRIYKVSLKVGEWKGDIFNASAIAKDYLKDKISEDLKKNLWIEARRFKKESESIREEATKNGTAIDLTPEMIGASVERIGSELIVKKCIELRIEL